MSKDYRVGTIGADTVKILVSSEREEVEGFQQQLKFLQSRNQEINMSNSGEKITVSFGKDSVIVFVSAKFSYIHVEIHSAEADGCNLENMTMGEIIERYDRIANQFSYQYGFPLLQKKRSSITFSYLELNVTFPVKTNVCEYKRVFSLFIYAFSHGKKATGYRSCLSDLKNCLREDAMFIPCGSYSLRMYNKSRQLYEEVHGIQADQNLLRIEITYLRGQALSTDGLGGPIISITDDLLRAAFLRKFDTWGNIITDYFKEKSTYAPGYHDSLDTVANVIGRNVSNNQIDIKTIFAELSAYESTYGLPCLFDVEYLQDAIQNLIDSCIFDYRTDAGALYNEFIEVLNSPPMHHAKGIFIGQKEKLEEIIRNVYRTGEPYYVHVNE